MSKGDLEYDDIDPAPVLDKVKVAGDEEGAESGPVGDLGEGAHLTALLLLLLLLLTCLPR